MANIILQHTGANNIIEVTLSDNNVTTWGSITGSLSDQVDLKNALDAKADLVDFSNVDNTSDLDKPISNATQAALDLKSDIVPQYVITPFYSRKYSSATLDFNPSTTTTYLQQFAVEDKQNLAKVKFLVKSNPAGMCRVGIYQALNSNTPLNALKIAESGDHNIVVNANIVPITGTIEPGLYYVALQFSSSSPVILRNSYTSLEDFPRLACEISSTYGTFPLNITGTISAPSNIINCDIYTS